MRTAERARPPEHSARPALGRHRPGLLLPHMRVTLADPPAYTPPYDHALAAALARAGADVELLTSRFRYGTVPSPEGYALRTSLYPVSSRLGRARVRLAVKALEHPLALARLAATRTDILHLQWVAAPVVGRLAAPLPCSARAHRARPAATAHEPSSPSLEAALLTLRPSRDAQRERSPQARRHRRRGRQAPGHPPPRVPQRRPAARRRPHGARTRGDPCLQGAPGRDSRDCRRRRCPARRRRRSPHPARGTS